MPKKMIKIEVMVEVQYTSEEHLKEAITTAKRDVLAFKTGCTWWRNTPKKARVINKPHKMINNRRDNHE